MVSKASPSLALFIFLNLVFFTLITAWTPPSCPCSPPKPNPKPKPKAWPRDALILGVRANLLGLVNVVVGSPPTLPCCSFLEGLAELEEALCLCTALKANVLGLNLNVPISLSSLLNDCGMKKPSGFECA